MNFKEFLKPTVAKIILTIILFILASVIIAQIPGHGAFLPLPLSLFKSFQSGDSVVFNFSIINFILDLFIWYLISCLVISLIKKRS